jgi:hypothetical protein
MVAAIVAVTYLHDHHREPNELREIHTRIPIILPEKHHDAGLSFEAGKRSFGPPPQRAIYAKKNRTMKQSSYIYSNHCIKTYEEIKERFHFVTYQTGDPDVVRV